MRVGALDASIHAPRAVGTFERHEMGGIPIYATGGGGGPIEAFSDIENHFLRVTVETDG